MKRSLTALIICLYFSSAGFAQQQPATPKPKPESSQQKTVAARQDAQGPRDVDVVKITTKLVQVDAVVTGKDGKPVTDLRPEEIEIREDGRAQKITHFSYVTSDPTGTSQPAKPVPTPAEVS